AIFPPDLTPPLPWMVRAPMSRHIAGVPHSADVLLEGRNRPLRTLIVCADTSGYADGVNAAAGAVELKSLKGIHRECETIRGIFRSEFGAIGNHAPEVLCNQPGAPLTEARFLAALEKPWDIVHFAGHSHYEPANNKGYL